MRGGWNHNTHYHPLLLRRLPRPTQAALDVGCGDGSFAELLAERCTTVTALDSDAEQVAATTARCAGRDNVRVQQGDFLSGHLQAAGFDVVTALASFHHMPFDAAAREADRVLKPGGRLVVLGVWTDSATPRDLLLNVASSALHAIFRVLRGGSSMTAPMSMERTSWVEARHAAARHLPGARLRRRLLWRYTLVWDKPGG